MAVIEARIAKIAMIGSLALFALVVTFDNITDYDTNFEFVRHVLSMDAIFPGSALLYRQVTSPALWNFAYWLIIIGEGITSFVLGIAAVALLRQLRSDGARFNRAKRFVFIGATLGVSRLVLRVHGGRRRVVPDVAISEVEWPARGLSLLSDDPCRLDLCEPGGWRSATITPAMDLLWIGAYDGPGET